MRIGSTRIAAATVAACIAACAPAPPASSPPRAPGFRSTFAVDRTRLRSTGRGRYLVLEPGHRVELAGGGSRLVVTVTNRTRRVDGVETRVVEEREQHAGQLVEVSRNYLAIDPGTGDVYYFGEDVDEYEGGRLAGHGGSWHAGEGGARFGLLVPGAPTTGDRFQQELAPGVAEDRGEVLGVDATVTTPVGTFAHCLDLRETSPLDRDASHKQYAPGVGLIRDDEVVLVAAPAAP